MPRLDHYVETFATEPEHVPWSPGVVAYGEMIAIRLAVELVSEERHPDGTSYLDAARHLGAIGRSRRDVLGELAGMLSLYGVKPIGTVRRALDLASPDVSGGPAA